MIVLAVLGLLLDQSFQPLLQTDRPLQNEFDLLDHDDKSVGERNVTVPNPLPVLLDSLLSALNADLPQIQLHCFDDLGAMTGGSVVDRDMHSIEVRAQVHHFCDRGDPMELQYRPLQPKAHPDDFGVVAPAELGDAELKHRTVECAIEERSRWKQHHRRRVEPNEWQRSR